MSILQNIKRWFGMIFGKKAKEEWNVENVASGTMESHVKKCGDIYRGVPEWAMNPDDGIETINLAKTICEEVARLTTLAIQIKIDGSNRANYLQEQIDKIYYELRKWVEYASAYGTIVLKPNGDGVDVVLPDKYMVTDQQNGEIKGIVFFNQIKSDDGKWYYTRLEYHRFIDDLYVITNKCYRGATERDFDNEIPIDDSPWADLAPETAITNLDSALYGVMSMPNANSIDIGSALALPIFSNAVEELKGLDIAYSRNINEIYDSEKIVLLDADRMIPTKGNIAGQASAWDMTRKQMKLPHYVRNVMGDGSETFYQEINPKLNTADRISAMNNQLSIIGFKCGFSNGYFVFDQKTGMVTATQVEADDRRTIQLIKDCRDQLEKCMDALIYALNKFADLYTDYPAGTYEVTYDFGDITYNREEDRARWWMYVQQNKVPAWMYFEKFEGMSEEEAKAMIAEATPAETGLFDE